MEQWQGNDGKLIQKHKIKIEKKNPMVDYLSYTKAPNLNYTTHHLPNKRSSSTPINNHVMDPSLRAM
jgi:hypothetical protein